MEADRGDHMENRIEKTGVPELQHPKSVPDPDVAFSGAPLVGVLTEDLAAATTAAATVVAPTPEGVGVVTCDDPSQVVV